VANNIESYDLSQRRARAFLGARRYFYRADRKRPDAHLTHSSGAHDNGRPGRLTARRFAFISDLSGEEELYLVPQDGSKPPQQITSGGSAMRYQPMVSGRQTHRLGDKDGKIQVVTLADRKLIEIVDSPRGQIRDYAWSPRGAFLAFSMAATESGCRMFISGAPPRTSCTA